MAATDYCQPAELLYYYDKRRLYELASDTNNPLDDSSFLSSPAVLALLNAVAAKIDARCQQGKRYARLDLETIASDARANPSDAAKAKRFAILNQLAADLFFGDLMARRGYGADQMKQLAPRYEDALLLLEQLFQGAAIFDLDPTINAGVPSVQTLDRNRLMGTDFNRMFGIWPQTPGSYVNPYGLLGSWRY